MASARGGKGRTQRGRRSQKERSPQRGRSQKNRGRRSPAKQKKHRGRVKRQPMKKQKKGASKRSFLSNANKMLKQIKGDGLLLLSHQAKELVISFVEDVYNQVWNEAERLRRKSRAALIRPAHVRAALRHVVPKKRWSNTPSVATRNRH